MEPDLDQWTSIFLIAACTGIFISAMLFLKGRSRKILRYPAAVVGAFSIVLIQYVLYWSSYRFQFPFLNLTPNLFLHLIAVWLLKYGYALAGKNVPIQKYLLYMPTCFALAANLLFWTNLAIGISPKAVPDWQSAIYFGINPWIVVTAFLMVCIFLVGLFRSADLCDRKPLGYLAGFTTVFLIAFTSYFVLVNFSFFNVQLDYAISVVMSLGIYGAGTVLVLNAEALERKKAKAPRKTELLDEATTEEVFGTVLSLVKEEKLYRDEDLRLEGLANQLELPRNYVSYAINNRTGKNFNRFVNDIRLSEAVYLLRSCPEMPVKNIYYQVGFSNKASFYSAFKRSFGLTPSEFRREHATGTVVGNGQIS